MRTELRTHDMRRVIRSSAFASALLFVTALVPCAYGDIFDSAWTGGYGPGSAVLTATDLGGGTFLVTAISSGVQNGLGITLLPLLAYGENDNQI